MRLVRALVVLAIVAGLAACGFIGSSEITVEARNASDVPMEIQVFEGIGPGMRSYGPPHVVDPLEERLVELAVPAGDWTVVVNDQSLFGSPDAAGRTGRLPVTLLLPAPDDPIQGPRWQAPADWAGAGG